MLIFRFIHDYLLIIILFRLISFIIKVFKCKKRIQAEIQLKSFKQQGMRESNSHQRFWRPLSYHLTNPLSKPTCKISFTVAIIHIKATIVKLIVHFYYKEFYKERAEMEGFEPSHRLPGLPHFECGPFSLLGTSPY